MYWPVNLSDGSVQKNKKTPTTKHQQTKTEKNPTPKTAFNLLK